MIFAWDVKSSVTYPECALLSALSRDCDVLEIGCWLGRSTIAIASTAATVMAVDWHQGDFHAGEGDTEAEFRANLERYEVENVDVVVARVEECPIAADAFGGVFIDAAHDADSVIRHWNIALDAICDGGWIAVHDYGRFDVTDVLDALELEWEGVESLVYTVIE